MAVSPPPAEALLEQFLIAVPPLLAVSPLLVVLPRPAVLRLDKSLMAVSPLSAVSPLDLSLSAVSPLLAVAPLEQSPSLAAALNPLPQPALLKNFYPLDFHRFLPSPGSSPLPQSAPPEEKSHHRRNLLPLHC